MAGVLLRFQYLPNRNRSTLRLTEADSFKPIYSDLVSSLPKVAMLCRQPYESRSFRSSQCRVGLDAERGGQRKWQTLDTKYCRNCAEIVVSWLTDIPGRGKSLGSKELYYAATASTQPVRAS